MKDGQTQTIQNECILCYVKQIDKQNELATTIMYGHYSLYSVFFTS